MQICEQTVLPRISIVLVNTENAGNIGSVARAMKTMGLSQLILVAPKKYPDPFANWMASGAQDVLDNARIVDTLDEAVAGFHLLIATSARSRRIPWPLIDARACSELVVKEAVHGRQIAILMGPESQGLNNEVLQKCHLHLSIPASSEYSVLNVAMAVQIVCYEIRMALINFGEKNTNQQESSGITMPIFPVDWDIDLSTQGEFEAFLAHYEEVIAEIGFLDAKAPRQLLARSRRLFSRIRMDKHEVSILRGLLSQIQSLYKK